MNLLFCIRRLNKCYKDIDKYEKGDSLCLPTNSTVMKRNYNNTCLFKPFYGKI